jgi:hypothetical protein
MLLLREKRIASTDRGRSEICQGLGNQFFSRLCCEAHQKLLSVVISKIAKFVLQKKQRAVQDRLRVDIRAKIAPKGLEFFGDRQSIPHKFTTTPIFLISHPIQAIFHL